MSWYEFKYFQKIYNIAHSTGKNFFLSSGRFIAPKTQSVKKNKTKKNYKAYVFLFMFLPEQQKSGQKRPYRLTLNVLDEEEVRIQTIPFRIRWLGISEEICGSLPSYKDTFNVNRKGTGLSSKASQQSSRGVSYQSPSPTVSQTRFTFWAALLFFLF